MQRYQWLLFDADGTLFDFDRAEIAALEQAFQLVGVAYDPGYLTIYQRINQILWQAVEKGEIIPGVVKIKRFELLLQDIGVNGSADVLSDNFLECLAARIHDPECAWRERRTHSAERFAIGWHSRFGNHQHGDAWSRQQYTGEYNRDEQRCQSHARHTNLKKAARPSPAIRSTFR